MKEDAYVIQAEGQRPIKIEFEGPVINRADISFPEPVLVWHNTEYTNSIGDDHENQTIKSRAQTRQTSANQERRRSANTYSSSRWSVSWRYRGY